MSDGRYGKCDVCRYCVHDGDDWACMVNNRVVTPKATCPRYRPGTCETCSFADISFGVLRCRRTGEESDEIDVCSDYDPCGRGAFQ